VESHLRLAATFSSLLKKNSKVSKQTIEAPKGKQGYVKKLLFRLGTSHSECGSGQKSHLLHPLMAR